MTKKIGDLTSLSELFLGGQAEPVTAKEKKADNTINEYLDLKESGKYFQIEFKKVEQDGTLSVNLDGIKIIMPADQITGEAYDLRFRAQKLSDQYKVKVIKVDTEESVVVVSHHEARMEMRPGLVAEIDRRLNLKRKSQIIVRAKVVRVQETRVYFDIGGFGIVGYIDIRNWKPTFTTSLYEETKYGDVLDIVVLEKKQSDIDLYTCSRKELLNDPWQSDQLIKDFSEDQIVKIRCLSLHDNHWFGEIDGLKDIQVFTEYPSQIHNFKIIPGGEYIGKIYKLDPTKRMLKARVFQALAFNFKEIKSQ